MKIRALVFDDDEAVRSLLWRMLDKRGYEVFTFPHPGACPLHDAETCYYSCADIVISDMQMPGVTGLEFIKKQIEKGCKVRNFALVSGAWSRSDYEYAARIGCRVFYKPVNAAEFSSWLDECERSIDPDRVLSDTVLGSVR